MTNEMEKFIMDNLMEGGAEQNEEGLLKGHLNDKFKIHYADYSHESNGRAERIVVFHKNGKQSNEFMVENTDDADYAKEQITTYKNHECS